MKLLLVTNPHLLVLSGLFSYLLWKTLWFQILNITISLTPASGESSDSVLTSTYLHYSSFLYSSFLSYWIDYTLELIFLMDKVWIYFKNISILLSLATQYLQVIYQKSQWKIQKWGMWKILSGSIKCLNMILIGTALISSGVLHILQLVFMQVRRNIHLSSACSTYGIVGP